MSQLRNKVPLFLKTAAYAALVTGSIYGQWVYADEYHYNNMLIGDRASGLGGAYVAVADDPSGMFYNPAGIAYSANNNLSASMNAYHITVTKYRKALGNQDWTRTSSILLPNFFGVSQPLGKGTFGFSYAVVDSVLEDQDQTFSVDSITGETAVYTINFNNQDNTFYAGPSYAIAFNKAISIGLTLYAVSRTQERILNQTFVFGNDACTALDPTTNESVSYDPIHWQNEYVARTEYSVNPVLGVMATPVEKLSIGLTLSRTVPVYSNLTQQISTVTTLQKDSQNVTTSCNPENYSQSNRSSRLKRTLPVVIGGGVAYFASNDLLISGSGWLYSPVNFGGLVFNGALGIEYYVTDTIAIRMGTFTNMANTPQLAQGGTGQLDHVNYLGGSLSISNFTRSSALTLGLSPSLGVGKAQVVDGQAIQDVNAYALTLFMSASYSY